MINFNFLESFIVLSETLSFSKTAKLLNTSQPVISRQIKDLESSLGLNLFIRNKKSVVLSSEGQDLVRKIAPLYAELKSQMGIQLDKEKLFNLEIRFGSIYEAGEFLMLPKLKKFKELNPETILHTVLQPTQQIIEQIENGNLDFGFVSRVPEKKSIKSAKIATERAVLIGGKHRKNSWKKDKTIEVIGYREDDQYLKTYIDKTLSRLERKKIQITMSINSHRSIIEMVKNSNYLAVIPETSFHRYKNNEDVDVLEVFKSQHNLYLICHEQTLINKRKKVFWDFLISYIM